MVGRVRVVVYLSADDFAGVVEEYHRISTVLRRTPGLLANELLRSPAGDAAVLSEWESLRSFREWESGASHRGSTVGLREHQDASRGRTFDVFEVVAEYHDH